MSADFAPRSFWQILGGAFRLYARHPISVLAVGAVVPLLTALLPRQLGPPAAAGAAPLAPAHAVLQPDVLYPLLLVVPVTLLVLPLVGGALVHLVCQDAVRGTVGLGRALAAAARRGFRLVGAAVLVTGAFAAMVAAAIGGPHAVWMLIGLRAWQPLVSGLLLFLAMLGALYLALRCLAYLQIVLVEGRGPVAACVRSFRLTKGYVLRALGLLLCLAALSGVAGALLGLAWDHGSLVATVVLSPVFTIAFTLYYLDLRVRQEGSTTAQLAGEIGLGAETTRASA